MLTRKKSIGFQERWRCKYFFGETNGKPICLICKQQVEVAQEDIVQTHYSLNHAAKFDKYRCEKRMEKVAQLNSSLKKLQFLQGTAVEESDAAVKAGYMIAHTIVTSRTGRPFSDCTFIKECMLMTAGVICPDKRQDFEDIDLSVRTIARRISDLSKTLSEQLRAKVATFIAFSVSIDEYSIGNEVSHLAVFIRGVDNNMKVTEEFVDLIQIKDVTANEICERLMAALNKLHVDWAKIVSLARDSGPSSISSKVATIFKKELLVLNPGKCFYDLHSVWHSEVLFTEVLKIDNIIDGFTKIFRVIDTRRPMLFAKFHPGDHYGIFKGIFLKRILIMCDDLHEFVKEKEDIPELEDVEWLQDLAFVVDVKEHLTNLQGKVMEHNKLVMDAYDSLCAFEEKLDLMEEQLSQNDLTHFPRLESRRAMDSLSHVYHNEKCRSQILKLKEEFQSRIGSFENLEKLSSIFLNPFTEDPYEARKDLQLELIELQCDLSLKNKFSSVDSGTFYKDLESKYSNIKSLAAKILSMFGTMDIHKKLYRFLNSKTSVHFFRKSEKIWKSGVKIAIAQTLSPDFDMLVQIWKRRQAVPNRSKSIKEVAQRDAEMKEVTVAP